MAALHLCFAALAGFFLSEPLGFGLARFLFFEMPALEKDFFLPLGLLLDAAGFFFLGEAALFGLLGGALA